MLRLHDNRTPLADIKTAFERDRALEDFAAELTEAAYPLILQQRPKDSWLDLELQLWKVLGQTVKSSKRKSPC